MLCCAANLGVGSSVGEAETYARTYAESTFNDLSFSIDALKKLKNREEVAALRGKAAQEL